MGFVEMALEQSLHPEVGIVIDIKGKQFGERIVFVDANDLNDATIKPIMEEHFAKLVDIALRGSK